MYHITIKPDTYSVKEKYSNQNPYYGDVINKAHHKIVLEQHKNLIMKLSRNINYSVNKTNEDIPDLVFIANGGMSLPRLPESVLILPWMKYEQRRTEHKYLIEIFEDLHIKTIEFPGSMDAPYEGVAESKWFNNGELLVMGYGFRSTKETVSKMRILLNSIYTSYGVSPPRVISFHLQSYNYYHLDIAMLDFSQSECIIHKDAIKQKDLLRLQKYIDVHLLESDDKFCLNSVVDGDNLITHILDKNTKKILQKLTEKNIIECDTSEFEKSGGSVRCMVLDIYDPRLIKRKKQSSSVPSSPK